MESSFQIQQESLRNLQQETEDELLRDKMPPLPEAQASLDRDVFDPERDNQVEMDGDISPIGGMEMKTGPPDNFEVEIHSLFTRIREHATNLKERVKLQKEISESFILMHQSEPEDQQLEEKLFPLGGVSEPQFQGLKSIGEEEDGRDLSAIIMSKPQGRYTNLNDKSASFLLGPEDFTQADGIPPNPQQVLQNNDDNSFIMFSPANNVTYIDERDERPEDIGEVTKLLGAVEQNPEGSMMVPIDVVRTIVGDLKAKHRAEKDNLKSELDVLRRVTKLMASKVKVLQKESQDRKTLQLEKARLQHQLDRVKRDLKASKKENFMLQQKLDITKQAMIEFDHQQIETSTSDSLLIEQLTRENFNLQRLLLISESYGVQDYKSMDEQLKHFENYTNNPQVLQPLNTNAGGRQSFGYYGRKKNQSDLNVKGSLPEPQNQKMPIEIKMMIKEKQLNKEEERRLNAELRKQAEEEIMREMRMAEEYFIQNNNELYRTGKLAALLGAIQNSPNMKQGELEESPPKNTYQSPERKSEEYTSPTKGTSSEKSKEFDSPQRQTE